MILPHVMAYNAAAAPEAMDRIARAIGALDAPGGLFDLAQTLNAPTSLASIGMPADGIDRAIALALSAPYWNPEPLEEGRLRVLFEHAYAGSRPGGAA